MPIYNKYKLVCKYPDMEEVTKIFNSRKEIMDALEISENIFYKMLDKKYDAKYRPHLDPKFVTIERIPCERAYLNKKNASEETKQVVEEEKMNKKFNEGVEKMKKIFNNDQKSDSDKTC